MTRDPHYLRVARALALITGLAGVAVGCAGDHSATGTDGSVADASDVDSSMGGDSGAGDGGGTDAGPAGDAGNDDAGATDGGAIADGGVDCDACVCFFNVDVDAGLPMCEGDAVLECGCAVIGPLSPPDLPV